MITQKKPGRPESPNKAWTHALHEGRIVKNLRQTFNYRNGLTGEMTQRELSFKSQLSRSLIAEIETGHRPMTNRTIKLLAQGLECDPREIRFSYQPELELVAA